MSLAPTGWAGGTPCIYIAKGHRQGRLPTSDPRFHGHGTDVDVEHPNSSECLADHWAAMLAQQPWKLELARERRMLPRLAISFLDKTAGPFSDGAGGANASIATKDSR